MSVINREQNAPVLVADPSRGKTGAICCYLDIRDDKKPKKKRVTVIVAADAHTARKQASEFGALANTYQKNTHPLKISAALHNGTSVRVVMSPAMFYKLCNENDYFKTEFLPHIKGADELCFVFDEIHAVQNKKIDDAFDKLRKSARDSKISVYCIGLTATPNEDLPSTKLMGKPVQLVTYTSTELASFVADLCMQPDPPQWDVVDLANPNNSTGEHDAQLSKLKTIIVGSMIISSSDLNENGKPQERLFWKRIDKPFKNGAELSAPDEFKAALSQGRLTFSSHEMKQYNLTAVATKCYVTIDGTGHPKYFAPLTLELGTTTTTCIERLLSQVMANQVHNVNTGGDVFTQIEINGRPMSIVQNGKLGVARHMHDSVLIGHAKPSGAAFAVQNLAQIKQKTAMNGGPIRNFEFQDLRIGRVDQVDPTGKKLNDIQAHEAAINALKTTFKKQGSGPSLGIINPTQMKGNNDFSQDISSAICVGPPEWMTKAKKEQFRGRLGRAGKLNDGSIVPLTHKMVHLNSSWASKILSRNKRQSRAMSIAVKALWDQLGQEYANVGREVDARIETNMRKLIKIDEDNLFPESLAEEYLKSEMDPTARNAYILAYMQTTNEVISYYDFDDEDDE